MSKLILDEWVVREVIDTLYQARTTFLGITGLDSPQEVARKSAKETAITRRISSSIDLIQQSEKPINPEGLDETDADMIESIQMYLNEWKPEYVEKEHKWLDELKERLKKYALTWQDVGCIVSLAGQFEEIPERRNGHEERKNY